MSYSAQVLDHYENPRNVGSFDKNDESVGTGMVGAPACGDVMKLQIKVDENGIIQDAKFKTYGCLISTTLISTFTKQIPISQLKPGDEVISWNGFDFVPGRIKNVIKRSVPITDLVKLRFEGFKRAHTIITTRDHVWWTASQQPRETNDLNINDECFDITEYTLRRLTNIRHRKEFKEKLSQRMIEFNKNHDNSYLIAYHLGKKLTEKQRLQRRMQTLSLQQAEEYWEAWKRGMAKKNSNTRPTAIERKFIEWFNQHNFHELKYVGDGSFWAGKSHLNPDFKVKGQRKVIEVYTEKMPEFMMKQDDNTWKEIRSAKFNEAGFECHYISIEQLQRDPLTVKYELQQFIHNGIKLLDKKERIDWRDIGSAERDKNNNIVVYDLELEDGANVYFVGRVASHNCGSAIASSSLVTEWVKGKTLDEAMQIKNTQIAEELALPPVKIHCSILAEDAIKAAIEDYKKKKGIT